MGRATVSHQPGEQSRASQAACPPESAEPLRFAAFYFPGYRVLLDGKQEPNYPTTNMGLLTVTVPAGEHQLRLVWAGTAVQKVANLLSALTLVGLSFITWRYNRRRWLVVVPLGLLTAGIFVMFWRPSLTEVQAPSQPFQSSELSMLGYRWEQSDDSQLYVYPYWYARKTPDPDMRVRFRLYDDTGRLVGWELARPFFNSHQAGNWPPGTVVDDAYALTSCPDCLQARMS